MAKQIDKTEFDAALVRIGRLEDAIGLILQLLILNRPPLNKSQQYVAVLDGLKNLLK